MHACNRLYDIAKGLSQEGIRRSVMLLGGVVVTAVVLLVSCEKYMPVYVMFETALMFQHM